MPGEGFGISAEQFAEATAFAQAGCAGDVEVALAGFAAQVGGWVFGV